MNACTSYSSYFRLGPFSISQFREYMFKICHSVQIWNHPGILQLRKENKDSAKCEDVENPDDISSDENIDYNMIPGGTLDLSFSFCVPFFIVSYSRNNLSRFKH